MKKLLGLLLAFAFVTPALYAQDSADEAKAPIVIRGILDLGKSQMFSLAHMGEEQVTWKKLGQSYDGYTLDTYNAEKKTLTLKKGEEVITVSMAVAQAPSEAPAGLEGLDEATELMELIKFEEMVKISLDQQKKSMRDAMTQMAQQRGGEIDENMIAFQERILDEMNNAIDWEGMTQQISQVYADTFTEGELQGMVDFYNTPAGSAFIEKGPEVQQKTMEVMMPQMMSVMGRIEELSQEFEAEMRAKAEAEQSGDGEAAAETSAEPTVREN